MATRPLILVLALAGPAAAAAQTPDDVPVTMKELDVEEAIREFQAFQLQLGRFRQEIDEGRSVATETAQILEELRATAGPENDYNEGPILEAVTAYVEGPVAKQVELVDFLESQRYRISYYANKMAASLKAEDLALIFGTEEQNRAVIGLRVRSVENARAELAEFVAGLPPDQLDARSYKPLRSMPQETRRRLDALVWSYQQERNALELSKRRLQIVRAAARSGRAKAPDVEADLLIGQMFHGLDRIRLQMSLDLMYLEQLLSGYAQTARTQEILQAFQDLMELQGTLEGPSPELAGVLDWLQDSSARRISLGARDLSRPGLSIPRYSDVLREAVEGVSEPLD